MEERASGPTATRPRAGPGEVSQHARAPVLDSFFLWKESFRRRTSRRILLFEPSYEHGRFRGVAPSFGHFFLARGFPCNLVLAFPSVSTIPDFKF